MLTREGAPHFLRDLEGVSAGQAKTIIILQPDTAKVCAHISRSTHNRTVFPLTATCLAAAKLYGMRHL